MSPESPDRACARIVFFTGGTALRETSRALARKTRHSVHLVTTFDSGGSSAALRRAFAMPAVGDMRNRLLALADADAVPPAALAFFAQRLPGEGDAQALRQSLHSLGMANHPIWADLPGEYAQVFRRHLGEFLRRMPPDFDARLACLGNLLLAGGYLRHKRDFGPPLALFSRLLAVRGMVLPIVEESLHLAAELTDGRTVTGQHHFRHLPAPVARLYLSVHEPDRPGRPEGAAGDEPCRPPLTAAAARQVRHADVICYPMGSFYSSVLATLLPRGVGTAIAGRACPKVFIPNTGEDAELHGLTIAGQTRELLRQLRADAPGAATRDLLHCVLADSRHGRYAGGLGEDVRRELADMGVTLLDRENLVRENEPDRHVPESVAAALLELAGTPGGALPGADGERP